MINKGDFSKKHKASEKGKMAAETIRSIFENFNQMDMASHKQEKKKCWEYMQCGQNESRSCPTVIQSAGRRCWLVSGSLNGGKPRCLALTDHKVHHCKECSFYLKVKKNTL